MCVGGGLLVPALYMGANLKIKEAIATSLFIIFLFEVFGLLSYVIQGREIDYNKSATFAVGGALKDLLVHISLKKSIKIDCVLFFLFLLLLWV